MSLKISPLIRNLARPIRTSSKPSLIHAPRLQIATRTRTVRWNSTQSPERTEPPTPLPNPTPPNAHRNFYKQFGRPVAKVFLMAVFTYQVIYWVWVKLDMDEIVAEREAEVKVLEAKLEEVLEGKEKKG